jgi:hypothetical protein
MELRLPRSDSHNGGGTVATAAAIFAGLSLLAAITSDGFLDADAATHFAYARHAMHDPYALVNVWARPLATGLFMFPAAVAGRLGVRFVSLICALVCGVTAWRLAIAQRYRWPALAAIFTLGQPLLFLHSFSEMTELPFAALMGLAFLAYRAERWWLLAILGSLLPLGRPEGFGFCLLAGLALIAHRRGRWLVLLPLPVIAWNVAGWIICDRQGEWWLWLIHNWPYSSGSDYPSGSLFQFLALLPVLVSPVALLPVGIAIGRGLRRRFFSAENRDRCQWLIAFIPTFVLVVHSLIFWLGRFSSDGELRYLLIADPFWGLLAADGWEWVFSQSNRAKAMAWANVGLLAPGLVLFFVPVIPLHMSAQWQAADRVVSWYKASPLRREFPNVVYAHPAIGYFLDDSGRSALSTRKLIVAAPAGCFLVWDGEFSVHNADPSRDVTAEQAVAAGWKQISLPSTIGWNGRVFLSKPEPGQ